MHETIIARNIITEAEKHGDILELHLEIGELAHVPKEELLACLQTLVPWSIIAREKKAECECLCGYTGPPVILERGHDSFLIECPECASMPSLTEGTDIKILKVVVK
jgi:Zn finger protein HypA/HybF involved in hydrogenase expression